MELPNKIVMLTWHVHRRTRQLCASLNIPLVELYTDRVGMRRYSSLISQTLGVIRRDAPSVLIVQNPSLVLALLCCLIKPLMRFKLVVDAHNEAIDPVVYNRFLVRTAAKLVIRLSDLTIVTNTSLAQKVRAIGGRPHVLPDAIPEVPRKSGGKEKMMARYALVISTVAPDEPLHLIIESARELANRRFLVTGNAEKFGEKYGDELPGNIELTGYVCDEEYWDLIRGATVVVDLSSMADCLVCGSYEAVALDRPLILTRNRATVEIYSGAALLVENSTAEIVSAIEDVFENETKWHRIMEEFRHSYLKKWNRLAEDTTSKLLALSAT